MKTRLSLVTLISLALAASAHAGDAHFTLKKLTWDPRQPDNTPYQDVVLDPPVYTAVGQAWGDIRPAIQTSVTEALTQKQLKSGVTLYDVDLKLPLADPDMTIVSTAAARGIVRLFVPHVSMEFKATHPLTSRDTDPRMAVTFDMTVDLTFSLNGKLHPPLEFTGAFGKADNVHVVALNGTAALAGVISDIESSITGRPALTDMIKTGIDKNAANMSGTVVSYLRKSARQLDVPPGYTYNGGRVDPGRITIAAWQPMPLAKADVAVLVTWETKYGRIIPNCDPLQLKVSLPYAPPPYGESKHIDTDNYPAATTASMQLATGFGCTQSVSGPTGVSGMLKYKEWVVESGHPRTPGMSYTVRAVPVHVPEPIVVGDASRGKAQLKLDVREGIHDGSLEHDKAQEVLSRKPGDPVERSVNPAINNAAQRNVLPAASVTNAPRVADDLNPQPLPPGPSDRKAAGATRAVSPVPMNSAPPSSLTGR